MQNSGLTNHLNSLSYVNSEGIEITCPVCGLYSAGTEMANKYGNGWRIPLQVLEKTPYECRCGTKYRTQMQQSLAFIHGNS